MTELYQALSFYFVHFGYTIEFSLALWLFTFYFPKRKYFVIRAIGFFLIFESIYCCNLIGFMSSLPMQILLYSVISVFSFFAILFCYKVRSWSALYGLCGALAMQHLSFRACSMLLFLFGYSYESWLSAILTVVCDVTFYALVFQLFKKQIKSVVERPYTSKLNLILGLAIIVVSIVLHQLEMPFSLMQNHSYLYILFSIYGILGCIFTLGLQYGIFNNQSLSAEKRMLEQLVHQQSSQYQQAKENIELINIKCHDMKHQISKLSSRVEPETLQEITSLIEVYDSALKTGNEVLDVFLCEKLLRCRGENIHLDCVVDGKSVAFFKPSDCYAIFGNAIDNAIEAVRKIENEQDRLISLRVTKQMSMVIIHVENKFEGELTFVEGLPQTTKLDKRYHGYGLRSIHMVVEKYGGNVTTNVKDGVFNLNILIPTNH